MIKRIQVKEFFITMAAFWFVFAGAGRCWANAGEQKVAIVHFKDIKPYVDLNNSIDRKLGSKVSIKTFELTPGISDSAMGKYLEKFGADVTVCIGKGAYELCEQFGISPIVLAYNTNISVESNPFSILKYLRPKVQKTTIVLGKASENGRDSLLISQGKRFDLKVKVKHNGQQSLGELILESDAIALEEGALIIKAGSATISKIGPSVVVFDSSVKTYKQLQNRCVKNLTGINSVIDIAKINNGELGNKLKGIGPGIILCIGANAYQQCKFMEDDSQVLVAVETDPIVGDMENWGNLSCVSMFADPKDQLSAFNELIKEPVTLAIPYDPQNTELLVLKTLLENLGKLDIHALAVSDNKEAGKVITKTFDKYDGVWAIPDATLSSAPIQQFLLEKSLLKKKILVAMMHPYTKRGAMMAVSGVGGNSDELGEKMVELINAKLNKPNLAGRVIFPPSSISVNVKTIENLNYKLPKSLLDKAEDVYGK